MKVYQNLGQFLLNGPSMLINHWAEKRQGSGSDLYITKSPLCTFLHIQSLFLVHKWLNQDSKSLRQAYQKNHQAISDRAMIWYLTPRLISPPNCVARITTVISTPYQSCFRIGRESCKVNSGLVFKDSRMFRGNNQWQNSNLMLTWQNYRLGRAVATLWALNIGAAVSDTHTQYSSSPFQKAMGNMVKVTKIDSVKGSLANMKIKPKMFTNNVIQYHSQIPRSALWQGK